MVNNGPARATLFHRTTTAFTFPLSRPLSHSPVLPNPPPPRSLGGSSATSSSSTTSTR